MVVNATVVAMEAAAAGGHGSDPMIYQVGSSTVRNPMKYSKLQDYGLRYFTSKPWIDKNGKPVKVGRVTVLSSMDTFHTYMALRYLLLLKVRTITYPCTRCIIACCPSFQLYLLLKSSTT